MPNKKVIDLSHWNTIPKSLNPARSDGVRGVIHKASEGTGNVDDKYSARRKLASDADLLFGAYHFLRPGSMSAQADHFLRAAQPDEKTLLAADLEVSGISLDDLAYWLDRVEQLAGIRPVIYSGHTLKELLAGKRHPVINGDGYELWLAQYSSAPTLPAGWATYWLWQWTQSGSVAGIDPPVDLNDYQGSDSDLADQWTSGAADVPAPEPSDDTLSPTAFQAALKDSGFYKGEIDGLSGPMTRDAVDEWFADGSPLNIGVEL